MSQKMITIPADDIVCVQVGSLGEYQEKCRRSRMSPEERDRELCKPTTFQEMFSLPAKVGMREALGLQPGHPP